MADVINAGNRKLIKAMAVTCQTAQFVSLMPKPKDFVTRIVGDVVLLSSKVQKLSDKMNTLLDEYSDIPTDYLMTQVNSITGSMTGIINRVNTYTQNAIDKTLSAGENTLKTIQEVTETAIDSASAVTQAVESLSGTVAHTSSEILGQTDVAEDVQDATEVIMEWTGEEFENISSTATEPIVNATQTITNAKESAMNSVNNAMNTATTAIEDAQTWVENLIKDLKEKMDKLSEQLDGGFKDVTGINSISSGASTIATGLNESDNDSSAAQATAAAAEALAAVLKNFSISKVITAFAGVITQATIVRLGLDQLPPIDFESMLCKMRNDMVKSNQELYDELTNMVDDIDTFNKSIQKADEREYSDANYKEFVKQFSEDITKRRNAIRLSMQNKGQARKNREAQMKAAGLATSTSEDLTDEQLAAKEMNEKLEIKSAIKEIKKFKKKAKNAKQANKYMSIIGKELDNFKNEAQYCCNDIKSTWNSMMNQYRKAISEIKEFFQNGGDGDQFINDCCDKINQDCDEIKEMCSNLKTQLIACTIKVSMPADIGSVVPNPVYKLASFWMDVKTIFKFIKDLITKIIDILNNIKKLARIMLNGFNNIKEIINQLMEMLGIKWFMDLIQSIIDLFQSKITDARELLENTLSPVYYKDTDEYAETLEILESMLSDENGGTISGLSDEQIKKITGDSSVEGYNVFYTIDYDSYKNDAKKSQEEAYENLLNSLDEKGEEMVAYRSPILDTVENDATVSEMAEGTNNLTLDVTFKGWHYFHPNLDHTGTKYYGNGLIGKLLKKIKTKIIERASRKSNLKTGGVNMLKRKKIKSDISYGVFYWYTYYTEDIEKDCFEMDAEQSKIYIDSVITTDNGSIVQLDNGLKVFVSDNRVKSGDYVNVNGVKYRVK